MTSRISVLLLLFLVQFSWIEATNVREKEKQILDKILDGYDVRIRPAGGNGTGPLVVIVNMFIRSISEVDDRKMQYKIQVTHRQHWIDKRLEFNNSGGIKFLTLTDKSLLWIPDLFFSNEIEAHEHDQIKPNLYLRIYPSGSVLFSVRLSLTLSCPMNLKLFPFDRQVCSLRMASYGYTTDDMVFVWKNGDPAQDTLRTVERIATDYRNPKPVTDGLKTVGNAVQMVKNLHIPLFSLEKWFTDNCNSRTTTGEYSCLKVDLLFDRDVTYYLVNLFIPSVMLVILSWISFWLDRGAITARSIIGVATLLAAAARNCTFNSKTAVVSYTRAADVWMGVCLTFLFAALVETAIVNYVSRREARKLTGCCQEAPSSNVEAGVTDEETMKPLVNQPTEANGKPFTLRLKQQACGLRGRVARMSWSKRLDVSSRILFPVVFVVFVLWFNTSHNATGDDAE